MRDLLKAIRAPACVALAAVFAIAFAHGAHAAKKTVCTITVNSSDEKEAFRRHLPADRYEFVELVERGRPDWLETARQKGIRCDILIISGHYDGGDYAGGNEFFSEHVDSHEFLPVEEMERVACSEPDDGLFSRLKEVYLFGCNTLNPQTLRSAPPEIARTLVQSGHSAADAERLSRALSARYADSSRDRMRQIFRNVPAIYGFSRWRRSGPTAATYLDRYLRRGACGKSQAAGPSAKILGYFPGRSLTLTRGLTDADADAGFRRDVCQHLRRPAVHRAEGGVDSSAARPRHGRGSNFPRSAGTVRVVARRSRRGGRRMSRARSTTLPGDRVARMRYLEFLRESDRPAVRARMIEVAGEFGWLSPDERRAEMMRDDRRSVRARRVEAPRTSISSAD